VRNQLVFDANHTMSNRFQLCTTVFKAVRKLHKDNESIPDSINTAMTFCSRESTPVPVEELDLTQVPA